MDSFLNEWKDNLEYFELLGLMGNLSKLFSDNSIPYLHYRIAENIFCKCFNADNLSRSDTAYDARFQSFGVGIKTFQTTGSKVEKIAEFNSISAVLRNFRGKALAYELAKARNERLNFGKRLYNITEGCYHIIGRDQNGLQLFNCPYNLINVDEIHGIKERGSALTFEDDKGFYSFNHSKSTLFMRFETPNNPFHLPIEIISDPYELLKSLLAKDSNLIVNARKSKALIKGKDYIILPLYSTKTGVKEVPQKSGLNQWNASGRLRNANEVYIPIPSSCNKSFPNFFPSRDISFSLILPNKKIISAKVCQENSKALMSKPNKDLGEWILRDVLQLNEEELLTIKILEKFGFDSVVVYKDSDSRYRIDVSEGLQFDGFFDDL